MSELNEILEQFEALSTKVARLYFVTRAVKDGQKKTSRSIDKYSYKCWKVETDLEVQVKLFEVFEDKVRYISNEEKFAIADYTIVTDDLEDRVFTYKKKEKLNSFIHIVDTDLKASADLEAVTDLEDIRTNLWAYIVEVIVDGKIVSGLRKIYPSKILTGSKNFLTMFDEESLTLFKKQSVTFDSKLDAVYYNDTFFIVEKNNFEEIVGLQEEYKDTARGVADAIMSNSNIEMNYNLTGAIAEENRFLRKLTKIKDKISSLDADRIKKMKEVAKTFNLVFSLSDDGKIIVNDEKQLEIMIRLIDDYYLQSNQTGKKYGAPVKTEM